MYWITLQNTRHKVYNIDIRIAYPLYSQGHAKDPIVIAKLIDPVGSATWYFTEYDPVEKIAFCYVVGLQVDEFGYTCLCCACPI
jgi:hypothetical protein